MSWLRFRGGRSQSGPQIVSIDQFNTPENVTYDHILTADQDNVVFTIEPGLGAAQFSIVTGTTLRLAAQDYETTTSLQVDVRVTSLTTGLSSVQRITAAITDVAESGGIVLRNDIATYPRGAETRSGHGGVDLSTLLLDAASGPVTWRTSLISGDAVWTVSPDADTNVSPTPNTSAVKSGSYTLRFTATLVSDPGQTASIDLTGSFAADVFTVSRGIEIDGTTAPNLRQHKANLSGKTIEIARGIDDARWIAGGYARGAKWLRTILFGVTNNAATDDSVSTVIYSSPLTWRYADPNHPYVFTNHELRSCADCIFDGLVFVGWAAADATQNGTGIVDISTESGHPRCARLIVRNVHVTAWNGSDGNTSKNAVTISGVYDATVEDSTFVRSRQGVTVNGASTDGVTIQRNLIDGWYSDGITVGGPNTVQTAGGTGIPKNIRIIDNWIRTPLYATKYDGTHIDGIQTPTHGAGDAGDYVVSGNSIDQQGGEQATQACLLPPGDGGVGSFSSMTCDNNTCRISGEIGITMRGALSGTANNNTITHDGLSLATIRNDANVRQSSSVRGGYYSATGSNNINPSVVQPIGTRVRATVDKSAPALAGTPYAVVTGDCMFVAIAEVPIDTPPTNASNQLINTGVWTIDLDFSALPTIYQNSMGAYQNADLEFDNCPAMTYARNLLNRPVPTVESVDAGGNIAVGDPSLFFQAHGDGNLKLAYRPVLGGPAQTGGVYAGALNPDGSKATGAAYP